MSSLAPRVRDQPQQRLLSRLLLPLNLRQLPPQLPFQALLLDRLFLSMANAVAQGKIFEQVDNRITGLIYRFSYSGPTQCSSGQSCVKVNDWVRT
jgi:hypothetical protein